MNYLTEVYNFNTLLIYIVVQEKKKQLEEQLPAEPDVGAKDVATIRLRCPDGASIVRRFHGDDKLEVNVMIM